MVAPSASAASWRVPAARLVRYRPASSAPSAAVGGFALGQLALASGPATWRHRSRSSSATERSSEPFDGLFDVVPCIP
eukprot:2282329-Pyramimonas_sp.AAC.1